MNLGLAGGGGGCRLAGMSGRISLIFLLTLLVAAARADEVAARVIVLANGDEPESVRLAEYYAVKRGVPKANIIAPKMPITETVTWRSYVDTVLNPLMEELVKRGAVDAIGMDLADDAGRKKYAISGHDISYLVVCRGVPLKIMNDPLLASEKTPPTVNPAFKTNAAAVDSELALLAMSNPPKVAFVPNPLFKNDRPSEIQLNQIVKVSRLDGPTFEDARRLVDKALEAERTGLIGRSYVDIGGPHAGGDRWLEETAKQLEELNFDGDVDKSGGSLAAWARMDAPALYFGWYAGNLNGPFAQTGFTFPPGAVALHIHSYSADTLRTTTRGWTSPLIARGATATFGNVNEPYLEFTHQPQLLVKSLARGYRLGDAAAYSVIGYSWQAIVVGDPLYRPFKVSLAEQWARKDKLPPEERAYVTLRRMRELDRAGQRDAAIWAGLEVQKKQFSLAVALAVVELQRAAGDLGGVKPVLEPVTRRRQFTMAESPLAVLAAQRLGEAGEAKAALGVWQAVLGGRTLVKEVRVQWLKPALNAARAAKDARQTARWEEEYRELTAPPPTTMTEAGK